MVAIGSGNEWPYNSPYAQSPIGTQGRGAAGGVQGFPPVEEPGERGGVHGSNPFASDPNSLDYFREKILPSCDPTNPVHGDTDPDGGSSCAKKLDLLG